MIAYPAWIKTEFVYPPIPDRRFDWQAIDDRHYSGDPRDPIGQGETEQAAIDDLLDQICMARGADADNNNGCRACSAESGIACRALDEPPVCNTCGCIIDNISGCNCPES
jgi:hypothetical protein